MMDLNALVASRKTRQFVVTMRAGPVISSKHFDDLPAARAYWCERAMVFEDKGMNRFDFQIMGFHEED